MPCCTFHMRTQTPTGSLLTLTSMRYGRDTGGCARLRATAGGAEAHSRPGMKAGASLDSDVADEAAITWAVEQAAAVALAAPVSKSPYSPVEETSSKRSSRSAARATPPSETTPKPATTPRRPATKISSGTSRPTSRRCDEKPWGLTQNPGTLGHPGERASMRQRTVEVK